MDNRAIASTILLLGCITIPFSTSKESFFVLNFGVLFFLFSGAFGLLYLMNRKFPRVIYLALFISLLGILFSFLSETILPSLSRALVQFLAIMSCVYFYFHFSYDYKKIEKSVIISGLILCTYYIVNYLVAVSNYGLSIVLFERAAEGPASLPWGASNIVSACILITYLIYINSNTFNKRSTALINLLYFLAILLTFSRTGIALFIIAFMLSQFNKGAIKLKGILLFLILVLCLAGGFALLNSSDEADSVSLLLEDRTSVEEVTSGNGRIDHWISSVLYFVKNPLNPVGYYGSMSALEGTSHNWLLTSLVEQGLVVLLLNLLLMFLLTYKAFTVSNLLGGSVLIVFLNLFVEDVQFVHPYMFYFSFLILIVCLKQKHHFFATS